MVAGLLKHGHVTMHEVKESVKLSPLQLELELRQLELELRLMLCNSREYHE